MAPLADDAGVCVPLQSLIQVFELGSTVAPNASKNNPNVALHPFQLSWGIGDDKLCIKFVDGRDGAEIKCRLATLGHPQIPIISFLSPQISLGFKIILKVNTKVGFVLQ